MFKHTRYDIIAPRIFKIAALARTRASLTVKGTTKCAIDPVVRALRNGKRISVDPRSSAARLYALAATGCGWCSWNFTDTTFDTPGSCIVIPYITGEMLIVFFEWVMMMN